MSECLLSFPVPDQAETEHQQQTTSWMLPASWTGCCLCSFSADPHSMFMVATPLVQAAYGAGLPFPLNYILPYTQRRRVQRLLKSTSAEKVCASVCASCSEARQAEAAVALGTDIHAVGMFAATVYRTSSLACRQPSDRAAAQTSPACRCTAMLPRRARPSQNASA